MTHTALQWLASPSCWYTLRDEDNLRFRITRQPGAAERYTLEQVRYPRCSWSRDLQEGTVVRQLRNIKTLGEAKAIAQEEWI